MKNLFIYINPNGFDEDTERLQKLQIDNSLELGWKLEDIILVTNFPWEYNGVKAIVVSNENFCEAWKQASKINTTVTLFDSGFFKQGELYWFHDFDAFQQEVITEQELELDGVDIGLTDYGRKARWNTGSYFFNSNCGDIFHWIKDDMYKHFGRRKNEETTVWKLTAHNFNNINSRIKRLNITYNFGVRKIKLCYEKAIKPIKVVHFHPYRIYWGKIRAIDILMYGKNELEKPIINERLTKLFQKYGYA